VGSSQAFGIRLQTVSRFSLANASQLAIVKTKKGSVPVCQRDQSVKLLR
jgi:hypothetical protein